MAGFFYANTWHAELFSRTLDNWQNTDSPDVVEYAGKKWCRVPYSKECRIVLPWEQKADFYISFECFPIPPEREYLKASDVYREGTGVKMREARFNAYIGYSGENISKSELIYKQETIWDFGGDTSKVEDQVRQWINTGQWPSGYSKHAVSTSTKFGLQDTIFLQPMKIYIHVKSGDGEVITNAGKGTRTVWLKSVNMIYICGMYIRNIILSEDPIAYSDTIKEVAVDSIAGTDWYTSNGKSYTEKVNAEAGIRLNCRSLREAKEAIDARKFAFSGVAIREGERINALEISRGGQARQVLLDMGEHFFGTSWDVTPAQVTDTMKITARKVVGK